MAYAIGVDVGGTFTDAILDDNAGTIVAAKAPSTPPDYSRGVMDVLSVLADELGEPLEEMLGKTDHIAHGTTSSLNALVTGRVPPVGFITTRGHRDSIYIMNVEGRYLGAAPHELQNVMGQKKHPLLPKRHALEVTERIDRDGNVVVALDEESVRDAARRLLEQGIGAIAVSLLWSFKNPAHEQRIREIVHEIDPDIFVALSSEVSPRIREFARSSTTIMSAQIGPGLRDYLGALESRLAVSGLRGPLLVMQSNGGAIAAAEAPSTAISTVGSVLTGGVIGAVSLGEQLGHRNIITTDVGGTTFLVGLVVDGEPVRTSTIVINHHPVNVPALEVHAIGSGGGAIAWIDRGGNLQVGPRSAQSVPGPACYGAGGTEPTNTDANLVLGILPATGLLGGRKALDMQAAREAIRTRVAEPLGLTVEDAAAAIYAIQNAQTGDLLRKTVVEAGHDPRDFVLYAFGGAGPAYCASYAAEVGVREVVVPLGPVASAFSAFGLAASDIVLARELSDPGLMPVPAAKTQAHFEELERKLDAALARQGMAYDRVEFIRSMDLRYTAQLAEVSVPVPAGSLDEAAMVAVMNAFERRYAGLYGEGTGFSDAGIQSITLRVQATGVLPFNPRMPKLADAVTPDPSEALTSTRKVFLDGGIGFADTPVYDYRLLRHGHVITGPAIIEVPTTTVVVPPNMTGTVDHLGNLSIITRNEAILWLWPSPDLSTSPVVPWTPTCWQPASPPRCRPTPSHRSRSTPWTP
jgi:N-methylhydantoinase A